MIIEEDATMQSLNTGMQLRCRALHLSPQWNEGAAQRNKIIEIVIMINTIVIKINMMFAPLRDGNPQIVVLPAVQVGEEVGEGKELPLLDLWAGACSVFDNTACVSLSFKDSFHIASLTPSHIVGLVVGVVGKGFAYQPTLGSPYQGNTAAWKKCCHRCWEIWNPAEERPSKKHSLWFGFTWLLSKSSRQELSSKVSSRVNLGLGSDAAAIICIIVRKYFYSLASKTFVVCGFLMRGFYFSFLSQLGWKGLVWKSQPACSHVSLHCIQLEFQSWYWQTGISRGESNSLWKKHRLW